MRLLRPGRSRGRALWSGRGVPCSARARASGSGAVDVLSVVEQAALDAGARPVFGEGGREGSVAVEEELGVDLWGLVVWVQRSSTSGCGVGGCARTCAGRVGNDRWGRGASRGTRSAPVVSSGSGVWVWKIRRTRRIGSRRIRRWSCRSSSAVRNRAHMSLYWKHPIDAVPQKLVNGGCT